MFHQEQWIEGAKMQLATMTSEGKYLAFHEQKTETKTKVFAVSGKGTTILLGFVKFRPQWRCYVFIPEDRCLFDWKCLEDIKVFLIEQNNLWREGLRAGK